MPWRVHPDILGLHLQIATHTSKSSCYIRLENMVFDVTPFLKEHPGGEALLLPTHLLHPLPVLRFEPEDNGMDPRSDPTARKMLTL